MTSFEAGEQTLHVKQVHIHPLYAEGKPDNDMAVVELKQKIVFKKSVLPACLPDRDFADSVLMAGDYMGVVTGWKEVSGATDLEGNLMLNHLSYDKLLGCSQRHSGQVGRRVSIYGVPMVMKNHFTNCFLIINLIIIHSCNCILSNHQNIKLSMV